LTDVDAVDGARHGLEEIGEDHGGEEKEVGLPEMVGVGDGLHGLGLGRAETLIQEGASEKIKRMSRLCSGGLPITSNATIRGLSITNEWPEAINLMDL